jgi:AraC-like DNA-binding protein
VGPYGTLAAVELVVVVEALERLGFEAGPLLETVGLAGFSRADAFARIDAAREHDLWEAITRFTGDPAVGLRVGVEHMRHGTRNLLEYLVVHATTLRKALETIQPMVRLVDDLGYVDLSEDEELARLGIRRDGVDRALGYVDSLLAVSFTFYSTYVAGFRLEQVRFTRARPQNVAPYAQLFGMMPVFGAEQNQLVFARRFLDAELRGGDPAVGELLNQHAQNLLALAPRKDPFLDAVSRAIARQLSEGAPSVEAVARAVGTSTRTLRRRLSALGQSYQELVDELRHEQARHELVQTDHSIDAIAERAGYSSRGAFERAFQRQMGHSPSKYRELSRQGNAPGARRVE